MNKQYSSRRIVAPIYQVSGKLHGRQAELKILKDQLQNARVEHAPVQMALVSGESGSGKSTLIARAFEPSKGSILWGAGKFEEQLNPKPFAALFAAVTELIEDAVRRYGKGLDELLDDEQCFATLASVMPSIQASVNIKTKSSFQKDRRSKEGSEALRYSLKLLMKALSSQEYPIVLCLDDLQWMDTESMSVLKAVLTDSKLSNFVFVGSYRSNEVDQTHDLTQWIQQLDRQTVSTLLQIQIGDLSEHDISMILADLLKQDEEEVKDLAHLLHERTKGNAFHILQMVDLLESEKLIIRSTTTQRWSWRISFIREKTSLCDNVVDLVMNRMLKLPAVVQGTLQACGILGFHFPLHILKAVASVIPNGARQEDLDDYIMLLKEEGMLEEQKEGHLKFSHDRIHKSALSLIGTAHNKLNLHYNIGKALWDHLGFPEKLSSMRLSEVDDRELFICTDQMNMASSLIPQDDVFRVDLAQLNYHASQKAASYSAFYPSLQYIRAGLALLGPETCWHKQYDLVLNLHTAMAEASFCAGEMETCIQAASQVQQNALTVKDRERAEISLLDCLCSQTKYQAQIELAFSMLKNLNQTIPSNSSVFHTNRAVGKTKRLIQSVTDEDILKLKSAKDDNIATAIYVMNKIHMTLEMQEKHNLQTLLNCRSVQMTFEHGLTPYTPLVFASAATLFVSRKNDVDLGFRFATLAITLLKQEQRSKIASKVYFHANFVLHWRTPLSITVDSWIEAHKAGMKNGDIQSAAMAATGYGFTYYYSGLPLEPLIKDLDNFCILLSDYGQALNLLMIVPLYQCVLNLTLSDGHANKITDLSSGKASIYRQTLGWDGITGQQAEWSYAMQIAFYCEDFILATSLYEKLHTLPVGSSRSLPFYHTRIFFFCLICIHNIKTHSKQGKLKAEVNSYHKMLKSWAHEHKNVNLGHKLMIVEAEMMTMQHQKHPERLEEAFDKAISASTKAGFLQDAGLAAHLASHAMFDPTVREDYFQRACDLYFRWGAHGILDHFNSRTVSDYVSGGFRSREHFDITLRKDHKLLPSDRSRRRIG